MHAPKSIPYLRSLIALAACAAITLSGCPPRFSSNVDFIPNIAYGKGWVADDAKGEGFDLKTLRLDVLTPNDRPAPDKPAVLMIHGGGFDGGSRTHEELVALADRLASAGYVCFLSDYRLTGDQPPAPPEWDVIALGAAIHASFVDAKTALRFIRANHARYGVNPDRIAVLGESAGAFAALAAGISDEEDFARDRADLEVPEENNPTERARPKAVIDFWGSANLILDEFSADDPPLLIVHGTADFNFGTFYYPTATNIRDRAEANNIPHVFMPLPGEGHGAWDARVDGEDLADIALRFLAEFL